jgi:hypothetical protein
VTLNEKIRKTKERLYSEYGRRRASRIKKDDRTAKKKKTEKQKGNAEKIRKLSATPILALWIRGTGSCNHKVSQAALVKTDWHS